YSQRYGLAIWAYCVMTNHVHFIAVPQGVESLGRTCRDAHQAYASWLNRKVGETGHLWQGRFFSCVLDDSHLWSAARYVERNPVRAQLVARAESWPWSSAAAHCGLREDPLLSPIEMPWGADDWSAYLREEDEEELVALRQRTRTGRPWGPVEFVKRLESTLGRSLRPRKRGPKPKRTNKTPTAAARQERE
ncbi:MAG TPA: transposase, partial [Phycisphaerae bacterium]|nr:transposase [Phycisphaerae bacterium]